MRRVCCKAGRVDLKMNGCCDVVVVATMVGYRDGRLSKVMEKEAS